MSTSVSIAHAPRAHRRPPAAARRHYSTQRAPKAEKGPSSGKVETAVIYLLLILGIAFFSGLFWIVAGTSLTA